MSYATTTLSFRVLSVLYVLTFLSCGEPRVHVVTSTTVGLEATPPMSDGSGVPRVTFGYKRAELALVPVCPVQKYNDPFTQITSKFWDPQIPPCSDTKSGHSSEPKTTEPGPHMKKVADTGTIEPSPDSAPKDDVHYSSILTKVTTEPTSLSGPTTRQDSYSTLGLFRLGLSWFGPARIEQFVATGQAAVELQQRPENSSPPATNSTKKDDDVKSSNQNKAESKANETSGRTLGKETPGESSSSSEAPATASPKLPSLLGPDQMRPSIEPVSSGVEGNEKRIPEQLTTPVSSSNR